MFKQLKINKSFILSIFAVLLLIWVIFEYTYALFYATIDSDAGYCLSLARDVTEGRILYKDVVFHYTPLIIYLFSLVKLLSFSYYNYTLVLLFQFIVITVDSFLVYKISAFFTKNKLMRLLGFIATLLLFFRYDGVFLELEPFVVFFSLLSVYFVLKSGDRNIYFVLAGLSAGLSFFSKQFGIIVFVPLIVYILLYEGEFKKSIVKLLFLAIGGVIPLVMFLLYYNTMQEVEIWHLFDSLTISVNGRFSMNSYILLMKNFVFYNGLFLIVIPVFFIPQKTKNIKYLLLFVLLFCLFSLSLCFGVWEHYKQFLIPYIVLIGLFIFENAKITIRFSTLFSSIMIICFLFIIVSNVKYFTDNYQL